jgi:hypothetical protein
MGKRFNRLPIWNLGIRWVSKKMLAHPTKPAKHYIIRYGLFTIFICSRSLKATNQIKSFTLEIDGARLILISVLQLTSYTKTKEVNPYHGRGF